MARASAFLRRPAVLVAIGFGIVVLLAGGALALRGGSGRVATPERGPATVAPPEVAVYAEVFLHAVGEQGANARKLLARALGEKDPGARLADIVGEKVDGGRGIAYAADVKPWLGNRAAVYFRAVAGPRSKPVLILETKSPSRARTSLVTGPGTGSKVTYRGVEIARRPDGTAAAVVGKWAVVGDLPGVRASVDAARGYDLGGTDRFRSGSRKAKEDRVGFLWVDLRMFGDLLATPLVGGEPGREDRERLELTDPSPVVANLSAKPTALFADFGPRPGDTVAATAQDNGGNAAGGQGDGGTPPGEQGGQNGPVPGAPTEGGGAGLEAGPGSGAAPGASGSGLTLLPAPLLPEVPADSWLAVGIPDFGGRTGELVDPAINPALPLDQVEPMLDTLRDDGFDLRGKVLPALGGMAAFVRGGKGSFDGGAIIEANDPAVARQAVDELANVLRRQPGFTVRPSDLPGGGGFRVDRKSLPQPLYLRARGNRIVVALGREAALDAIDSPRKLGDTKGFKAAAAVLAPSLRPDGYLDMPAALKIADESGVARRSAAYRTARPALDVVSWVAFAAKNRIRRFAIGVG